MNVFVGTSGYSYGEWKGTFYPEKMPAREMLRFYAERFGTTEINNTFYKLPGAEVFEGWLREVPPQFVFALKAQNQITHIRRLRPSKRLVKALLQRADLLGAQLGPILFQLPPNFKKDGARLKAFLKALPAGYRYAFEFRNETWFDGEVFEVLRARNVALCWADADDLPNAPWEVTADFGYVRLRRAKYSPAALKKWAGLLKQPAWKDAFIYFKHEETGSGPRFARQLLKAMG